MVSLRLVAGLLVFCVGIVVFLMPESVPSIPLAHLFVLATSFALILVGLTVAARTLEADQSSTKAPVVERPVALPRPGSDVEEQLEALSVVSARSVSSGSREVEVRDQFRTRLHRLAISVLVDHYGLTETEAAEALGAGVWSENPHAVAFFTGEYPADAPLSVRARTELALGKPSVQTQATHVVEELHAITRNDHRPRRPELVEALERNATDATPEGGADERQ